MEDDILEKLIWQAHDIFGETSIYEVMDIEDRNEAIMILVDFYGPVRMDDIEKYFNILNQIRNYVEPDSILNDVSPGSIFDFKIM